MQPTPSQAPAETLVGKCYRTGNKIYVIASETRKDGFVEYVCINTDDCDFEVWFTNPSRFQGVGEFTEIPRSEALPIITERYRVIGEKLGVLPQPLDAHDEAFIRQASEDFANGYGSGKVGKLLTIIDKLRMQMPETVTVVNTRECRTEILRLRKLAESLDEGIGGGDGPEVWEEKE